STRRRRNGCCGRGEPDDRRAPASRRRDTRPAQAPAPRAGPEGYLVMGLIMKWRKVTRRGAHAEAQEVKARQELAATQREVAKLRVFTERNRFAELLRDGIVTGYEKRTSGGRA